MRKIKGLFCVKLYEIKKKYPIAERIGKSFCIVNQELNKDRCKYPKKGKR